jgi:uncharacterized protein with PQ loop repeat
MILNEEISLGTFVAFTVAFFAWVVYLAMKK